MNDVASAVDTVETGRHISCAPGGKPYADSHERSSAGNDDVRWAVNYLLEQIAAKFEAWDTLDLFRSEAAATVRSFKHEQNVGNTEAISDNSSHRTTEPQTVRESGK